MFPLSPNARGLAAMVLACTIWGLSPLYFDLLKAVPPGEVLAHRIVWSMATFAVILSAQRRIGAALACLATPSRAALTLAAALVISVNWFAFIFAVQLGRAMEASLGYYIFPLFTVVLGVAFFGDRLRAVQIGAVALAALAVTVLTLGLGVVPAISLLLAISFGIYSALKRRMVAGAVASVAAETLLLAPLALIWLMGVHGAGWTDTTGRAGAMFGTDPGVTALLILSGALTGLPMVLLSYASQRVRLPTLGLVQYLNPTLQFLGATLVLAEPFTRWHAIAFPLIWTALALYSLDSWRGARLRNARGKIDHL